MTALKLSIKAGLDASEVVAGTAAIKGALSAIGSEAASAAQTYQSGARAMVDDSQAMAQAAASAGAANDAMASAAVAAATGVTSAGDRMEASLAGVTEAARAAASAAGTVSMPTVAANDDEIRALTAAVAGLEGALDPASRATQVLAARTELLDAALAAGVIDGERHAAMIGRVKTAHEQAANSGVSRMAAAVDHLEAEMDPAARAAQALAARAEILDTALASGAISAGRHAALMARVRDSYQQTGQTGSIAGHQIANLQYQLNDVATSLAGGMSPFMIVMQQGPQITQIFGGVRATLALIPAAAFAAAAAIALIAVPTFVIGSRLAEIGRETRAWTAEIRSLNPELGVTAERLRAVSFEVAASRGLDRADVSAGISAIIATGRVRGEAMVASLAGLAGDIAAVKGDDIASWATKLAEAMGKGAAGVQELDAALRFLTPEQARSITAMDRQGDRAGALAVATKALEERFGGSAKAMKSDMEDAFGQIGRAWDRLVEDMAKTDFARQGAAMGAALLDGLRRAFAPSAEDELASLNLRIRELEEKGPNDWGVGWLSAVQTPRWQAQLDGLKAQRQAILDTMKPPAALDTGGTGGGGTTTTPDPSGITAEEEKHLDRLRAALVGESAAMASNAAVRQVRLAGLQAETAALAAGRTAEAAKAERLIAEEKAMLGVTTAMRDQATASAQATQASLALAAARMQGAAAAMQAEAQAAAAAEALTSPIDEQARARALLADAVARTAAEGAGAVVAAEAEAAAQERLAAAAGGTVAEKERAAVAAKIEQQTAPLIAAMAVAEGKAKDELREIIERLTGAIINQDAAQKRAAKADALADQRRELAGIVALTRMETEMRGRSAREQRLAIEHQKALNDAQKLGIDVASDFGKEWLANADAIAAATLESQKFAAAGRTADALGRAANAIASGDPVEIGNALTELTSGFEDLLATTGSVGDAFDLLGKEMLNSAQAGQALGDLVGAIFGRTKEQQKNARIGSTVGGTVGSFFGMKGLGSFLGNIGGGLIGGNRAERDAKAQKAAADLDALTGSIANFIAANDNVTAAGQALRGLEADFVALSVEAKRLGADTAGLMASYEAARRRLIDNQNAAIYSELADLTGDVVGQFAAVRRANDEYIRAAIEGEADISAARQVAYLREEEWLSERTEAELDALGAVLTAADRLRARLRDLVATISTQLDAQIDQSRQALSAAQSSANAYRAAAADLGALRRELRQDDKLSTLTPQQRLAEAMAAYNSTRDKAMGGDLAAQREFAAATRSYLTAAQAYAGRDAYEAIFGMVQEDLTAAEISAAALAGGAEYQASLLETQIKLMEQIRDNLSGDSPQMELLKQQLAALETVNGLLATSNDLTIGQTRDVTAEQRAVAGLTRDVRLALDSGLQIVDVATMSGYLATLEAGLAGNNSAEARAQRDAIAVLRQVTADGLISTAEAASTRAALAVLGAGVAGAAGLITAEQRAAAGIISAVQASINSGLQITDIGTLRTNLDVLEAGLAGNNSAEARAQRDAIAVLRQVTADGLISTAEAASTRAALAVLGAGVAGAAGLITAEQRAAAGIISAVQASINSGLQINDIGTLRTNLDVLEAGLAGNNSAEARAQRDAIAVLRQVTADGLISTAEAASTRAALASLAGIVGTGDATTASWLAGLGYAVNSQTGQVVRIGDLTAEQRAALLASLNLEALGNDLIRDQTGEVISGNSGQDVLAKLLAQGAELNQDIVNAITGQTSLAAANVKAVTAGTASIVGAITEWIGISREQAAAEAAAAAQRAQMDAYNAAADSAGQATRRAAAASVNAAAALPTVEASGNQRATGLVVDATSGRQLWMGEDRGDDTSRARATGLAEALAGVARVIEGLTGGDISNIAVEAGNKHGLVYEVAGIRKTFGINDFAGAVRAFVGDAIATLASGDRAAVDILASQSYTDVAAGLAAASSAIYRLRNAAPAFAGGGLVRGPGSGTSDDILAWLSNGEHVIQASTVGRFGPDVIDLVNRGDLDGAHKLARAKGKLPRFAEGGPVSAPTLRVPSPPRVGPSPVAQARGAADSAELLRRVVERLEAILAATDDGQADQAAQARAQLEILRQMLEIDRRQDARAARPVAGAA